MENNIIKTLSVKAATDLINNNPLVWITCVKNGCEACEYFVPNVLENIVKDYPYWKFAIINIDDNEKEFPFFPGENPSSYAYNNGIRAFSALGTAPEIALRNTLNDITPPK